MYHYFQRQPRLRGLDFQVVAYAPGDSASAAAGGARGADQLLFSVTFVVPDKSP
jgi:hypothetical protein